MFASSISNLSQFSIVKASQLVVVGGSKRIQWIRLA